MVTTVVKTTTQPLDHANGDNGMRLEAGDYLTRPEFERRYHAHPEIKKAELIGGVVYMPSPVRANVHGDPHFDMITWLGIYRMTTPGTRGSDNASVRVDLVNEPQPDALLRIEPGGNSWIDGDGYLRGAPELVVEIAASSTSYDLHQKKTTYEHQGVQEYLVFQANERKISWFTLQNGRYEPMAPGADGIWRSQVFPGLWLHADAFWANEMATVMGVLQQGLASAEHQAFLRQLQTR